MFVAVVLDIATEDHKTEVYNLLKVYGYKEIMKDVFESPGVNENSLLRLKRDLDRATDSYDKIRFYQYPFEDTLTISFLSGNRWRKTVLKL
ncbi:MAG: CRISPR-associated endonuclease Cas2 [Spirochaetota bacterium]